METLFVLIGIFFGQQSLDVRIIEKYVQGGLCNQHAEQLTARAKAERQPHEYYCRAVHFTVA